MQSPMYDISLQVPAQDTNDDWWWNYVAIIEEKTGFQYDVIASEALNCASVEAVFVDSDGQLWGLYIDPSLSDQETWHVGLSKHYFSTHDDAEDFAERVFVEGVTNYGRDYRIGDSVESGEGEDYDRGEICNVRLDQHGRLIDIFVSWNLSQQGTWQTPHPDLHNCSKSTECAKADE